MKHLYFIRHGQSQMNALGQWGGRSDAPLTQEGIAQAMVTAKQVAKQGLSFDVIVSSPLQRAHHTAQQVAKAVQYPIDKIIINDVFVERSFGELEGTVNKEASEKYYKDEALIDTYKEVERMVDMQWRAQQALDYLNSLPHETVLVVGHGAFSRALRRAINKEPLHERGKTLNNAEIIKLI